MGYKVLRTNWDNEEIDWTKVEFSVFRTTWDYFDRYPEFKVWLDDVQNKTQLINSKDVIQWNMDKHYLIDLKNAGLNIPETVIIDKGEKRTLTEIVNSVDWKEYILKPTIGGCARHTYRFLKDGAEKHEKIF